MEKVFRSITTTTVVRLFISHKHSYRVIAG